MNEFERVIDRIHGESVASYLLFGVEPLTKHTEKYSKRIDDSCDKMFDLLQELFPGIDKDDEELGNILLGFASEQGELYFQAGMVMGFQLYKMFEQEYDEIRDYGADKIIRDCAVVKEMMQKMKK